MEQERLVSVALAKAFDLADHEVVVASLVDVLDGRPSRPCRRVAECRCRSSKLEAPWPTRLTSRAYPLIFKTNSVEEVLAIPELPYGRLMNVSQLTTPQRISAISIVVVAVAAFLPWVSLFGISVIGVEGDGIMTLVLALAGGVVLALTTGIFTTPGHPGMRSQVTLLVLAVLVALIGLVDMNGAAAIGLYLTLFAGVAWVVGAAWQLNLSKAAATEPNGPAS